MLFPWLDVVQDAVRTWNTPFYLMAWTPVQDAFEALAPLADLGVPVRHWCSVKTQTVKPLLTAWRERLGLGAEVVSLYELLAARQAGFRCDSIVVNGLAKHAWLPEGMAALRLHLDSLREVEALGAQRLRAHRLGARCHVPSEHDPDDATIGGQFGMLQSELVETAAVLRGHGLALEGVHFHMRSNVRDPNVYARAFEQALTMAAAAGVVPRYVDCGGGFPVPGELTVERDGTTSGDLPLPDLVGKLRAILKRNPSIEEVWFENGRYMTSRSAVLVLKILDVKERPECRYLLCDGGRTNHAFPSDWQPNEIGSFPPRTAPSVRTVICGPTCTAYDRIGPRFMPGDLGVGDYIIWFNAGAYHLSWENRFSTGLAKAIWCDEQMRLTLVRRGESFDDWWGVWA